MNRRYEMRGQALILVVLAVVGLLAIAGLVIDGGRSFMDRRQAQNAADAAALAAAYARIRGEDVAGTALKSAAQNGYNNNGESNVVEVHTPPTSGPYAGQIEYIQVTITSRLETYFYRVVGRTSLTNTVIATSRTKTPEVTKVMNGSALISLAPTSDCNNDKAFWVHGNTELQVKGGGIFINSTNETCAFFQNGNGSVSVQNGFGISAAGGASIQKPLLIKPGVAVGVPPVSYPPPFFMPFIECEEEAAVSEDGLSMSPGSWEEAFPPDGVLQLDEGVYCLGDEMEIKSNLQGEDVVLVVNDGEVRIEGTALVNLSAPMSGDNAGLLLYMPLENTNDMILNNAPESTLQGTILAPAAPIHFRGGEYESQIIGYSIEIDAEGIITITYDDEQNLNSMTMPEVQLAE